LIGLTYQHHHIPDWNPPADWPWKEVAYGRNSKGIDCSDFTSWTYNYGLGIKLPTNKQRQRLRKSGEQAKNHLRPFTQDSWYFQRFSHAHRIIP